ncbi:GNAT family N-acetyltransferase [Ornithinibacillus contaminans]|uniref:GNAT family N-acetyltransferase n=1 Tax=Ornithinibacillus contaminans TaxID=694055 RepID=UPI00064D8C30|nr:GNAT family N-acetyltransferase [Ornithinibacillus contaminans]
MAKSAFIQEEKNKEELKQELDSLEIQLFRMKDNIKKIAKTAAEVISIDQTPNDEWVVVYADWEEDNWQIMLHSCKRAFRGSWNSALQAEVKDDSTIHIAAIKGEENKGYGSVLMKHLKEIAREENVQYITGDLVERDFDHVDRLQHFYEKHNFDVTVDHEEQCGEIVWNDE